MRAAEPYHRTNYKLVLLALIKSAKSTLKGDYMLEIGNLSLGKYGHDIGLKSSFRELKNGAYILFVEDHPEDTKQPDLNLVSSIRNIYRQASDDRNNLKLSDREVLDRLLGNLEAIDNIYKEL